MNRVADYLRYLIDSLGRERSFAAAIVLAIVIGVAIVITVLGLLQLDSLSPLRTTSTVAPDYLRDPGWDARWNGPLWAPAQLQVIGFERLLWILLVVATLGFAVAGCTVIILVLVRAAMRTPELALRLAVGAAPRRLLADLFAEGALLATIGALVGIGLGLAGLQLARFSWPHVTAGGGVDPWIAGLGLFAPLLAVVPFAVFAAAGVLRRSDLSSRLISQADAMPGRGELVLQDVLATVQLAAAIALVIGAGLLVQNAAATSSAPAADSNPEHGLVFELDLSASSYPDDAARAALYQTLLDDVSRLESVQAESLATPGAVLGVGSVALATAQCGRCSRGGIYLPVIPAYVRLHAVSPGFFGIMGVRLREGREFRPNDDGGAPKVMIVNRTFAASHFEGGRPLGRKVQLGGIADAWYTVVGVVDDVPARAIGAGTRAAPVAFVPIRQDPPLAADLAVRASGDEEAVATVVREIIAGSVPSGITVRGSTLSDYLEHHSAPLRWFGAVLGLVGMAGLLLAMQGAYSVMRFKVARRRKEIGIHRALGARGWRIVRLIVLQTLGLTVIGAGLGAWGALLLAGWLDTIVPGLAPFDATIYGGALLVLSTAALAGGSLSARQATRVDPAAAIQTE